MVVLNQGCASAHKEESKRVILRDLDGVKLDIGEYYHFNIEDGVHILKTHNGEGLEVSWSFVQDDVGWYDSVSIDYGDELMILCNFEKSDLAQNCIAPLIDVSVLKLGLTNGLKRKCPLN